MGLLAAGAVAGVALLAAAAGLLLAGESPFHLLSRFKRRDWVFLKYVIHRHTDFPRHLGLLSITVNKDHSDTTFVISTQKHVASPS